MSCGTGAIAGPEVDMTESDGASSSSVVANAVDLDLNLGPPPVPRDRLALELALGGQEFEASVQVSRPNWPRFEPGMSGLLLGDGQEDEVPARPENRSRRRNVVLVNLGHQEIDRRQDVTSPSRGNPQEPVAAIRELEPLEGSPSSEEPRLSVLRQRLLRNSRHWRHLRRPRQTLSSVFDRIDTPASSGSQSTTEARIIGADNSRPSFASCRPSDNRRNGVTVTAGLDASSGKGGISSSESKHEDTKKPETGHAGAHFECNVCLEMATEPVVTCCGHLFCWPCLYQWLHVHSSKKECPVCKGTLSDAVITPIYGRGTVQDTEKSPGNIPRRPHAHRLNSKRQWDGITTQERHDRDVRVEGVGGRSDVETRRSDPERSNPAELILNRLRVAQRLQREHLDERLRLRQRMMRRGGALRFLSTIGARAEVSLDPVAHGSQDSEQHHREQILTQLAVNRRETTDSLAMIHASMDGLDDSIANLQRSVQIAASLPGQVGTNAFEEVNRSGLSGALLGEERMSPPRVEVGMRRGLPTNVDGQVQQDSPELPQTSLSEVYRAVNGASGSFDVEPGSLHARKRRRLN